MGALTAAHISWLFCFRWLLQPAGSACDISWAVAGISVCCLDHLPFPGHSKAAATFSFTMEFRLTCDFPS